MEHVEEPPRPPTLGAGALFTAVYDELRQIAGRLARGSGSATLRATALVHEAYLALCNQKPEPRYERQHFLRTAARVMRHLLIDHKRGRRREQSIGTDAELFDAIVARYEAQVGDLEEVEAALERIGRDDPDSVRLIELRFFAGLTLPECASAMEISESTAGRWWRFARARLAKELQE